MVALDSCETKSSADKDSTLKSVNACGPLCCAGAGAGAGVSSTGSADFLVALPFFPLPLATAAIQKDVRIWLSTREQRRRWDRLFSSAASSATGAAAEVGADDSTDPATEA